MIKKILELKSDRFGKYSKDTAGKKAEPKAEPKKKPAKAKKK